MKNHSYNFQDVTGIKYNYLTAVKFSHSKINEGKKYRGTFWIFKCDCGKEIVANISVVKCGNKSSCGCKRKANNAKNLVGKKFNYLKVINFSKKNKNIYWECLCDCGNIRIVTSHNLISNKVKSCGCKDSHRQKGKNNSRWRGYEDISGHYWAQTKQNARKRNLEFKITLKDVWNKFIKQNFKCALTNLDITFKKDKNSKFTASLDRIDSSKGYIIDNIQLVHKDINRIKQHLSEKRFIQLCKLVSKNN